MSSSGAHTRDDGPNTNEKAPDVVTVSPAYHDEPNRRSSSSSATAPENLRLEPSSTSSSASTVPSPDRFPGSKEKARLSPAASSRNNLRVTTTTSSRKTSISKWQRLNGEGLRVPSFTRSLKNIAFSSWLNTTIFFIPFAIASRYLRWYDEQTLTYCIFGLAAPQHLLNYAAQAFSFYVGRAFGDLVEITLHNVVEATLAIVLVFRCELRLLQATLIGTVILHLLLIPGVTYFMGGRKMLYTHLDPHAVELNKSMLAIGVITVVIPAAFFAGIIDNNPLIPQLDELPESGEESSLLPNATKRFFSPRKLAETASRYAAETLGELSKRAVEGVASGSGMEKRGTFRFDEPNGSHPSLHVTEPLSDASRKMILSFSHALAILLMIGYIITRIYLHNPPSDDLKPEDPEDVLEQIEEEQATPEDEKQPMMNQWLCVIVFLVMIPITAYVTELLVESIDPIREATTIKLEFFGLVILPMASYSSEAYVAIRYFIGEQIRKWRGKLVDQGPAPNELRQVRRTDLAIQFLMFWSPLLILLAWIKGAPLTLVFDLFEVFILVGAVFMVLVVLDDARTNWAEGLLMVLLYTMIAVTAWYYEDQQSLVTMMFCESVDTIKGAINKIELDALAKQLANVTSSSS